MATPPHPGTAVNSAALSIVSRMYLRWSAARASMGIGSRLFERRGPVATMPKAYPNLRRLSSTLQHKVSVGFLSLGPFRIASPDRVPANGENIQKHVNAVSEHVYFRCRRMP